MACRLNHALECDCCRACRSHEEEPEPETPVVECSECGGRIIGQYWNFNGEIIGDCCLENYLDRTAVLI